MMMINIHVNTSHKMIWNYYEIIMRRFFYIIFVSQVHQDFYERRSEN